MDRRSSGWVGLFVVLDVLVAFAVGGQSIRRLRLFGKSWRPAHRPSDSTPSLSTRAEIRYLIASTWVVALPLDGEKKAQTPFKQPTLRKKAHHDGGVLQVV